MAADLGVEGGSDRAQPQGNAVPTTGSVAGLAADTGLDEFAGFHIQPDGMAAVTAPQGDGDLPAVPTPGLPLARSDQPGTGQQGLRLAVVAHELLFPTATDGPDGLFGVEGCTLGIEIGNHHAFLIDPAHHLGVTAGVPSCVFGPMAGATGSGADIGGIFRDRCLADDDDGGDGDGEYTKTQAPDHVRPRVIIYRRGAILYLSLIHI